jgi:hypothetical protein
MHKLKLVIAAAVLTAGAAAPAIAQSAVVELSPHQQTTIIQDLSGATVAPAPSVSFDVSAGVVVPDTVELHPLPPKIIQVVPDYDGYEYFETIDGQIVIVAPDSKKIVTVLH